MFSKEKLGSRNSVWLNFSFFMTLCCWRTCENLVSINWNKEISTSKSTTPPDKLVKVIFSWESLIECSDFLDAFHPSKCLRCLFSCSSQNSNSAKFHAICAIELYLVFISYHYVSNINSSRTILSNRKYNLVWMFGVPTSSNQLTI